LAFLAAMVAASCVPVAFFRPHYIAAATPVIYALILQGMRALGRRLPRAVRAIPLVLVAMAVVRLGLGAASVSMDTSMPMTWERNTGVPMERETIIARLRAEGGQHLVIVRYGPGRNGFSEYVYNAAGIDASPIVWARDMGTEKNAELLRYFSSRKAWLLDVTSETVLSPYPQP
jgi:hypothetical protein